jgi:hypothetical protein
MKRKANVKSHRQMMWQSMRILKIFTVPTILRTVPGATASNAHRFLMRLENAGIIGKIGNYTSGRAGEFQEYALLNDAGPVMPVLGYGTGKDAPATGNERGKG